MTIQPFKRELNLPKSSPSFLAGILRLIILITVLLGSVSFLKPAISQEKPDPEEQNKDADLDPIPAATLIGQANQFLEARDFQKAIPVLEQLVKLNPLDDKMKSYLVRAYIAQGTILQNAGKIDQSLDLIVKSKKLIGEMSVPEPDLENNSGEARELVNIRKYLIGNPEAASEKAISDEKARTLLEKAAKSYKEKQFGLAKSLILEAIQYQPHNALAYELLGDSEYFSQNLPAAKEAYQKSFLNDAINRVKSKLEKVEREMSIEPGFSEYADEHFLIRYKRSEKFEGAEIRQYLREAYREVSHDFGYYLNFKTAVVLYGKDEYQAISNMPHWSGALYDGKIRIPIYDEKSDSKNLKKYIQHELTHVFITDMSDNRCPVWLHEGLAQYEENKIIPINRGFFQRAVKAGDLLSWEDLEKGVAQAKDQASAILFYHQSFEMAKYLIEKYRFVKIKALLQKLTKQGAVFEDAFKEVMGISLKDFYANWRNVVAQEFS